jgi:hypothetical protein
MGKNRYNQMLVQEVDERMVEISETSTRNQEQMQRGK